MSITNDQADAALRMFEAALLSTSSEFLPRSILDADLSNDGERLGKALGGVVYRATVGKEMHQNRNFNFKDVEKLFIDGAIRDSTSRYVLEALNYLRLYQHIALWVRKSGAVKNTDVYFDAPITGELARSILASATALPGYYNCGTSSLIEGKLLALFDRTAAAAAFQRVTVDHPDLLSWLSSTDQGARTYFAEAALYGKQDVINDRRAQVMPAHNFLTNLPDLSAGGQMTLMCCDRGFFRVYYPYWLSVAEYLKGYGVYFHFLLLGPEPDTREMVAQADAMRHSLAIFRGRDVADYCSNISFSAAPVPEFCKQARSQRPYYACARFLYLRQIVERLGAPIMVQDMDFAYTDNPAPWLDCLPKAKTIMASNRAVVTIDPWRQFLGGTFALPCEAENLAAMRHIEDYILAGLDTNHSWFLDQNALRYFNEQVNASDSAGTLASFAAARLVRPLQGFKVNSIFEAEQSRC